MKKIRNSIIAIFLAILAVCCFSACDFIKRTVEIFDTLPSTVAKAESILFTQDDGSLATNKDISTAVKKVEKSSVAIEMYEANGWGSGTIIDVYKVDENGTVIQENDIYYILTCYHVISNGGTINVYVPDENGKNFTDIGYNTSYKYTGNISTNKAHSGTVGLVGADKVTDLAVLKIKSTKTLTKSIVAPKDTAVQKGQTVFAIGNTGGTAPGRVTAGVVSYLDRSTIAEGIGNMLLTEIDVSTGHGNSGGGLYNLAGQLIGVTNAGSEEYQDLNYAIPLTNNLCEEDRGVVDTVKQLIGTETSTNYGYVSNRWELGITVSANTGSILGTGTGVKVTSVSSNGNGETAGLKNGDVITEVIWGAKMKTVYYVEDFEYAMTLVRTELKPGETFLLTINRGGITRQLTVGISKIGYIYLNTGK